jgi:phosphatidylserine/phosphatidylglycerophosphate/cardiolipin synthase-like enzyme
LVLANAGKTGEPDATNAAARALLHADQVDVTDRMMPSGHIGHDKFLVYSGPDGEPVSVLTGSTNWTTTGLCAQTNNAIVIDDHDLAAAYLTFQERLKAECPPARPATQSDAFRTANDVPHRLAVDGAATTVWFSPNTKQHTKPTHDAARPSDLGEVFDLIGRAQKGILFLLFQPGTPSVLDAILAAQQANPDLFIRGAATDAKAIGDFETQLRHRAGDPLAKVAAARAIGDNDGVVDDQFTFWRKELLKSSPEAHAIIHDKILVIDPMSRDCVVVTGSHNLGYRASYNNDENLLIVKGHRSLAEAYAVHVMNVYDHYRWRWLLQEHGRGAYAELKRTAAAWQGKYFAQARQDVAFWHDLP